MNLVERSLQLYCDNRVAKIYCKSDKSLEGSRHIDTMFLVIKDRVQNSIVSLDSISTILNVADSLTKGMPSKVFFEYIAHMR